jgi:16S rRNA (uracil1498-N3)-methyltransferase
MSVRCYVPDWAKAAETVVLDRAASHHVARVLRKGRGEALELFDGCGRVACGTIAEVTKQAVTVTVADEWVEPRPLPQVTLVQALVRPQTMDFVLRKTTELGVSVVQPVLTEHCVVRTRERPERWRKTVISAAEQCGANWLPVVEPVRTWAEWCAMMPAQEVYICALREGCATLKEALRAVARPAAVVMMVGPEGDFTAAEVAAAEARGAVPVSLGPLVLRVDTAAMYALVAVQYEWRAG